MMVDSRKARWHNSRWNRLRLMVSNQPTRNIEVRTNRPDRGGRGTGERPAWPGNAMMARQDQVMLHEHAAGAAPDRLAPLSEATNQLLPEPREPRRHRRLPEELGVHRRPRRARRPHRGDQAGLRRPRQPAQPDCEQHLRRHPLAGHGLPPGDARDRPVDRVDVQLLRRRRRPRHPQRDRSIPRRRTGHRLRRRARAVQRRSRRRAAPPGADRHARHAVDVPRACRSWSTTPARSCRRGRSATTRSSRCSRPTSSDASRSSASCSSPWPWCSTSSCTRPASATARWPSAATRRPPGLPACRSAARRSRCSC